MNMIDEHIDYNNYYINYNNYYNIINNNNEPEYDNLNKIIKDMEHLDEIREELSSQEYLDKSNMLYRKYNDLKRRLR